jgi:hypothetical protein
MKDVIIKCDKGEVNKTLAYIEKKDRKVKWATGDKPTGWGSLFERKGVYLIVECDVLTFIEIDEFQDSDKKGKDVVSAEEFLGKNSKPSIVIFRRGRNVIAKDVATGNEGIAKCSPSDEFVFKTGASIALARLMAKTPMVLTDDVKAEWKKALWIEDIPARVDHKFKVGDHVTLKEGFVAGMVYGGLELLEGAMHDNACNKRMTVVRVDWSDDSNTYYYECKGDSQFTFHYSEEMLDKWDESKICEGDTVKVINTGLNYSSYVQWVGEHISDPYMAARFCFGSPSTDKNYKVIKIAEHERNYRPLAYIEEIDGLSYNRCYLIEVEGLEKA